MDTNHESRGCKPSRHVEVFATKFMTSLRQTHLCHSNGIWSVTVQGESRQQSPPTLSQTLATQIIKVGIWALLISQFLFEAAPWSIGYWLEY